MRSAIERDATLPSPHLFLLECGVPVTWVTHAPLLQLFPILSRVVWTAWYALLQAVPVSPFWVLGQGGSGAALQQAG